jgi:hypothetical protein
MKLSLCFAAVAAAVAPPKISLTLDESASVTKLAPGIVREHDQGLVNPNGKKVSSQQDWTQRCPAGSATKANCPFPTAKAVDHQDQDVAVKRRIFLVDNDGVTANTEVAQVNFLKRSTYLLKYDATDTAGNHAEQVVFALILDDTTAPVITMCGKSHELVQAASKWQLCGDSTATDNIDGTISKFTYTIKRGKNIVEREVPLGVARGIVNANKVGNYAITLAVDDKAGIYGKGAQNNIATANKMVVVRDTLAPVIKVLGFDNVKVQCGATYTDGGALVNDQLDGQLIAKVSGDIVNTHFVKDYKIKYSSSDAAGNKAEATRTVQVRDTQKPSISLIGNEFMQISAGTKFVDPGFTGSDTCSSVKKSTEGTVNINKVGTYTLTYTVTDGAGNSRSIRRKVAVEDKNVPVISLVGLESIETEATTKTEWTDPGATCKDPVDGNLNNQVEVTGNTVNLRIAGKYTIKYNCMDIAGNKAATVTRTVTVKDTACPVITMLGEQQVKVEASYPYSDAGATAKDPLDGDLTKAVWSDGASVSLFKSFKSAMSCHEIKRSYPEATTGSYQISSYANNQFVTNEAWCDMHTVAKGIGKVGFTYVKAADCAAVGLSKAKTITPSAATKFGAVSLCSPNDEKYNLAHKRVTPVIHSHPGKYLVTYHVSDRDGNKECSAPVRTVTVVDTLPPVISLHLKGNLIQKSGALMEESQSSVNGWIIGAVASAVAGVALLGMSSKKTVVSVPV